MLQSARVLVVDDDAEMCDLLSDGLSTSGAQVTIARSAKEAEGKLAAAEFDAVVTDLRMPSGNADGKASGLSLCAHVNERWPDLPVLVHTGFGDMDAAIAAMRAGAFDFLSKPVNLEILRASVARAVERRRLRREVSRLASELSRVRGPSELLGESAAMERVRELVDRVAKNDATVLVTGESGTGKEIVARAIHRASDRAKGPFVAINCAALPEALLESELFGHERGAFTDAHTARRGMLVEADGGVLFLDEIAELPVTLQVKLLRAIQERRVRPLGGSREIPFDVRIIAATNQSLENLVESGRFREDLFFRLNVIEVELPPLRARERDVLLLAQHFLVRAADKTGKPTRAFGPAVADRLLAYAWPGNVRELENAMERAVALSVHDVVTIDDLPPRGRSAEPPPGLPRDNGEATELVSLDEMEKRYIARVLEATGGSRTRAAKILGVDRTTLWRKLDRLKNERARAEREANARGTLSTEGTR
ncbi:MAG: sigma-54 dependent transcriptional regulator [Polyangiaceae bacterium]